MCQMCDHIGVDVSTLTKAQLEDRHIEMTLNIADLARESANLQKVIAEISSHLDEVEALLESKEAQESGPLN
jgi:cell fate (sporulation/competence/biofilm development) regulator YlbF (YheA/YmcA/DUF963 family)